MIQFTCATCGEQSSYRPGRGNYRKYCSPECRADAWRGPKERHKPCANCGQDRIFPRVRGGQVPALCDACRARRSSRYRKLKWKVLARDGAVCGLCSQRIDLACRMPEPGTFTLDHIQAVSLGGSDRIENLRPAHFHCNKRRGVGGFDPADAIPEAQISAQGNDDPLLTRDLVIVDLVLNSTLSYSEITAQFGLRDNCVVRDALRRRGVEVNAQKRRHAVERTRRAA